MGDRHPADPPDTSRRQLATVELLGALTYGQLRGVEAVSRLIALAPEVEAAVAAVDDVERELTAYRRLHAHLRRRTDLDAAVMQRQRGVLDDYFDEAPTSTWFDACVFLAVGAPIAADFAHAVAGHLDAPDAEAVREAFEHRATVEASAVARLTGLLDDDAARARAARLTADVLGAALTNFQSAMAASDALTVLLAQDATATTERRVKDLAIELLTAHRRRTVALGIEDVEDEES